MSRKSSSSFRNFQMLEPLKVQAILSVPWCQYDFITISNTVNIKSFLNFSKTNKTQIRFLMLNLIQWCLFSHKFVKMMQLWIISKMFGIIILNWQKLQILWIGVYVWSEKSAKKILHYLGKSFWIAVTFIVFLKYP